jgi:hypothetical protein
MPLNVTPLAPRNLLASSAEALIWCKDETGGGTQETIAPQHIHDLATLLETLVLEGTVDCLERPYWALQELNDLISYVPVAECVNDGEFWTSVVDE